MKALPLLAALLVLAAGCIGSKGPAADVEPAAQGDATQELEAASDEAPAPGPSSANASSSPTSSPPPAGEPKGQATNATASPPPAPPPTTRVDVLEWDATVTAVGASVPDPAGERFCCASVHGADESARGFEVGAGLTGIVVELTWTDPAFDLDLILDAPDAKVGVPPEPNGADTTLSTGHWWVARGAGPGQPAHSAKIVVVDPEALALAGTWTWHANPNGAANAVSFHVAVSLFQGLPPPEDYSASA